MRSHHFFFLLLSLYTFAPQIHCQSLPCMTTPFASKYSSNSICGTPTVIEKSSSIFPNNLKTNSYMELSVDFDFSILQTCPSGGRTQFDLLAITISPDHTTDIILFDAYLGIESGNYWWVAQAYDGLGQTGIYSMNVANSLNSDFTYLIFTTINLSTSQVSSFIELPGAFKTLPGSVTTQPNFQFDQYTKIFLCADSQYNPTAYCKVHSFAMWYSYATAWDYYRAGLTPMPIATYIFNEMSGNSAADSANNLGTAYFGSSSASNPNPTDSSTTFPKWLSNEAGIEFTTMNQYIPLSKFEIPNYSNRYFGSLTFSFWLKFSYGGYLFRYSDYLYSFDYFSAFLQNDGVINIYLGSVQLPTDPIPNDQWKVITITFVLYDDMSYVFAYMDSTLLLYSSSPGVNFDFDPGDILTIGGPPNSFRGSLANFRIFSSGTAVVSDAYSCGAQLPCPVLLGSPQHKTCLSKSVAACHISCKTCIDGTEYGCLTCKDGYSFSEKKCVSDQQPEKLNPTTTKTIESSQTASRAITQVVNVITAGSPSGVSTAFGGKIFSNVKYLNISYSLQLEDALASWGSDFISLGLTPDMPNSVQQQIPEEPVPYVFEKRDVPSSFLINFWESLGMLFLVLMVFAILKGLEWVSGTMKIKYMPIAILAAVRAYVQNFVFAQLYSVYGDILLFSILEFREPDFSTSWSRLSFFSALILICLILVLLPVNLLLIRNYQKVKSNPEALSLFVDENKGNFIIFNDFKDYSFVRQSFLFLLTARDLIFSLLLATMFEHPLIESVFILCLNLAMVTYLILKPPFKSVFDATQQLFYEIIALAVNVCILIMAIMDKIGSTGTDLRNSIGKFIIVTNMIFNFGSLTFMLIKAFETFVEIYQNYKAKRDSKQKSLKIQNIHRFSPKSLDQSSNMMNSTFGKRISQNTRQNELKTINNEHQYLNTSSNNQSQINSILNSYRNNSQDISVEDQIQHSTDYTSHQNRLLTVKPRIIPK